MIATVRSLLGMIRFSHTLFALPFALLTAVMAWNVPAPPTMAATGSDWTPSFDGLDLLGIVLCMVAARSASMAFNRLADQDVDADNPRTSRRHLVTGELSRTSVKWFLFATTVMFVASTALFLPNTLPAVLSIPVLIFLFGYSYAKRFTALAHFWLGTALMLAPICAWIAIRGEVVMAAPSDLLPAVVVSIGVLLWVAGFDIIYACQDEAFDRSAKLKSIPVLLGTLGALRLSALCHAVMIIVLATFPWLCPQLELGWIYGLGIAAVALLLTYEHALVRPDDLARVNEAFFHVNAIISVGLFLVVTVDLLT